MKVQLFWNHTPRADAQIELFAKASDGVVTVMQHRTDAKGVVDLPAKAGFSILVDAVILQEPLTALAADRETVSESFWSAPTFTVPD